MDIGLTKMSTKGQIVIPNDLRADFAVGEKLVVIKSDDKLIIKKANSLKKEFVEYLEFAERTEKALKRIEKGNGTKMDVKKLMDEMKKW